MFPAASVAMTEMEFAPAARMTLQVKFPGVNAARAPLQVKLAMPDRASVTVPVTIWEALVTVMPLAGDVIVSDGAVLSSFTVTVAVAVLLVLSVTVPETTWPAVSAEITMGGGQVSGATPPPHVKVTVALLLFHPAALGAGVMEGMMESVVEFSMTGMGIDVMFPATSVAATVIVLGPGVRDTLQERFEDVTVVAIPLQATEARPEIASVMAPVTVICGLRTVAPDVGDVMLTAGGVLSIWSVTDVEAVALAASFKVPETTWPAPSVETVAGAGQVSGGVPPAQVNVTATLALFQPAAFGAGRAAALIVNPDGGE